MTTTTIAQPLYRIWTLRAGQLIEHERTTHWSESEARGVLPDVPGVRFAFGTSGRGRSTVEGWRIELVSDPAMLAAARAERERLATPPGDRMHQLAALLGSAGDSLERVTLQLSAESYDAAYTSARTTGHALAQAGFAAEYGTPVRDDDGRYRATIRVSV